MNHFDLLFLFSPFFFFVTLEAEVVGVPALRPVTWKCHCEHSVIMVQTMGPAGLSLGPIVCTGVRVCARAHVRVYVCTLIAVLMLELCEKTTLTYFTGSIAQPSFRRTCVFVVRCDCD